MKLRQWAPKLRCKNPSDEKCDKCKRDDCISMNYMHEHLKEDPVARCAYKEANIRRAIAGNICYFHFSDRFHRVTWKEAHHFAKLAGISQKQARLLLCLECLGNLHLGTIVKAIDYLGKDSFTNFLTASVC